MLNKNKLKDENIKLKQQLYVKELQVNMLNEIIKNQGEAKRQYDKDLFSESLKYQKIINKALNMVYKLNLDPKVEAFYIHSDYINNLISILENKDKNE